MKKMNKQILGIILLMILQTYLFGATYYVSTNGNDSNPGTIESPWRTINYGVSQVNAGTLYIRGGTYTMGSGININSGTAENHTVISAYPNENVTVTQGHFSVEGRDYWTLNGIKFHFSSSSREKYGIVVKNSKYFTISNNDFWQTDAPGILLTSTVAHDINYGCQHFKITGNNLYWNQANGIDESLSVLYASNGDISYNTVSHSGSVDSNCLLIDIKTYSNNIDVHHNEVFASDISVSNRSHTGIYIDGITHHVRNINVYDNNIYDVSTAIKNAPETYGAALGRNLDIKIYNNNINNCMIGIFNGWGNYLDIAGASVLQRNYIHDNTITNCSLYGIITDLSQNASWVGNKEHAEDIYIYNNTLNNPAAIAEIRTMNDTENAVSMTSDPNIQTEATDPNIQTEATDPNIQTEATDPNIQTEATDPNIQTEQTSSSFIIKPGTLTVLPATL